jgi:hypothetical protein
VTRRLHSDEGGWAVLIAIAVMTAVLATGVGILAFVDGVQKQSGTERVKETTFNLSEALLNNDALLLSNAWPSKSTAALPASCTRASTGTTCPSAATIASNFVGTDLNAAATWTVSVRDDLGAAVSYYSKAVTDTTACGGLVPCTWDSNKNGAMWVRAQATVDGRTRTLVGLVRQNLVRIALPRNVVTAGKFTSTNNGNKVLVDEKGCGSKHPVAGSCNTTQPAPVVVRCTTATPGTSGDACLGYRPGQLSPANYQTGYATPSVLTAANLNQMRSMAQQLGTYYTTCPSMAGLTGAMVFVEGVSCSYGGGVANSDTTPGTLVIYKGTLSLSGNAEFYGAIYAANGLTPPADAGNIVTISGTAYVQGAVYAEGNGGVSIGSSGLNIAFDERAITNVVATSGTASLSQNSFRELPPGQ